MSKAHVASIRSPSHPSPGPLPNQRRAAEESGFWPGGLHRSHGAIRYTMVTGMARCGASSAVARSPMDRSAPSALRAGSFEGLKGLSHRPTAARPCSGRQEKRPRFQKSCRAGWPCRILLGEIVPRRPVTGGQYRFSERGIPGRQMAVYICGLSFAKRSSSGASRRSDYLFIVM